MTFAKEDRLNCRAQEPEEEDEESEGEDYDPAQDEEGDDDSEGSERSGDEEEEDNYGGDDDDDGEEEEEEAMSVDNDRHGSRNTVGGGNGESSAPGTSAAATANTTANTVKIAGPYGTRPGTEAEGGGEVDMSKEEWFHNEYYKIWKKNAMYLYDLLITHTLTWPSLTVEWVPEPADSMQTGGPGNSSTTTGHHGHHLNKDMLPQRLILGSNTSGTHANYLIILKVMLPSYDLQRNPNVTSMRHPSGYGAINSKVENFIKIPHDGDINKARLMPQNPFLIATKSSNNKVLLFDYEKHESDPGEPAEGRKVSCRPDMVLEGHDDEGFGLSWNPCKRGVLASCDNSGDICIWDVDAGKTGVGRTLQPREKIVKAHNGAVCDVQWHNLSGLLASAGTDGKVKIYDERCRASVHAIDAHTSDVNCISFNPYSDMIFLTGSKDETVALWDMRNLGIKTHTFEGHKDEVFSVAWAPQKETYFASASADNRVLIWDLRSIGKRQSEEDAKEGPPELMFIHGGHTDKLCDISWNPHEPFLMASVAENNVLHLWKMGDHVIRTTEEANAKW